MQRNALFSFFTARVEDKILARPVQEWCSEDSSMLRLASARLAPDKLLHAQPSKNRSRENMFLFR